MYEETLEAKNYLQGKKPEQFAEIEHAFFKGCLKSLSIDLNNVDYHFSLANSAFQLTTYLGQKEVYMISTPPFNFFKKSMSKICFSLHWKDILTLQEILMQRSVKEHLELIRENPTASSGVLPPVETVCSRVPFWKVCSYGHPNVAAERYMTMDHSGAKIWFTKPMIRPFTTG